MNTFFYLYLSSIAPQFFWRPLPANLEASKRGSKHRQHLHSSKRLLSGLQHRSWPSSLSGVPRLRHPGGTCSSTWATRREREGKQRVEGGLWAGRTAQGSDWKADNGSPCFSTYERGGASAASDPEDGEWLRKQREKQQQPWQVGSAQISNAFSAYQQFLHFIMFLIFSVSCHFISINLKRDVNKNKWSKNSAS